MILNERNTRYEHLLQTANQIMTAARTAPKGRGVDLIEIATVTGDDLAHLSKMMIEIGTRNDMAFFIRDAHCILQAEAVILLGAKEESRGLNCGYCGYPACADKPEMSKCVFNPLDLGIAIGSACATAADLRVDTRVMFSAGIAAKRLKFVGDCNCVFAIPISASSKNPFFDRK
ncbi:MAG: DUF2148 domain-containing protein [Bacteroidales bacterium]|nr:DUF2148 domain-containing protein [Bacteroidales bacterium]